MKVVLSLFFVLVVNMLLFTAQISIDKLAEGEGIADYTELYSIKNSIYNQYDEGNYTLSGNVSLPQTQSQVSNDESNIFTDVFTTVKNWLIDTIPGARYAVLFTTAFPNTLAGIGLAREIVFILGALWYALGTILLILFVRGNI
jgi:hypothetical protein